MSRLSKTEILRLQKEGRLRDSTLTVNSAKPKAKRVTLEQKADIPEEHVFIPGEVPSSKNSKRIVKVGKHPKIIDSKATMAYRKSTKDYFSSLLNDWLALTGNREYPLVIYYYLIRQTKRKFDFHNAIQIVADLGTDSGWWPDDDMNHTLFVPTGYSVDKTNPGIKLWV